jgi:HK97 family phage major capsid protein
MDALSYIRAEMAKEADAAKLAIDAAEKAGRNLTDQDRAEVRNHTDRLAELREQEGQLVSQQELRDSVEKMTGSLNAPVKTLEVPSPARTIGEAFVNSKDFQAAAKSGVFGSGRAFSLGIEDFGTKANETVTSAGVPAADYVPGIQLLLDATEDAQPLSVINVLPKASTNSNRVHFIAESTSTNLAAATAEVSGTAGTSVLVHADTSVEVEKVNTILFVSEEMLQDGPAFQSYLDGRLAQFVEFEEEDQVVNGDGNTPNLDGLLAQTTQTQALGADTYADAVFKACTDVRTGGWVEPTHILIHPTDYQTLRLQKDSNDNYLMGMGPWGGPGAAMPGIWGLEPLISTRIAQGTALVGAYSNPLAVQLYRRGGVSVVATNSHASNFVNGIVAVKATSRLALVVYRINAFSEMTGL